MKFNGGKSSLAQSTVLALTAGLLGVIGVGVHGPASAAIACRETFADNPVTIGAKVAGDEAFSGVSRVVVPTAQTVASVRVTLDVFHPESKSLQVFVTPPNYTGFFDPNSKVIQSTTGPLNGFYTFDDAAATSIAGANKPAGLYKPFSPLSVLAGRATQGEWLIWINNYPEAPAGELRSASLTFTYADCPDANGDGLHDDADADGVLMPPDNCPDLANVDQLDSDVDGLGDACDATPYLPPVGQPGPRELSLKYSKSLHRFKGVVSSPVASCTSADVELWKRRKGADRRLSAVHTNAAGKFRTSKVRKPGRYYATVAAALVDFSAFECEAKTSSTVKLRR